MTEKNSVATLGWRSLSASRGVRDKTKLSASVRPPTVFTLSAKSFRTHLHITSHVSLSSSSMSSPLVSSLYCFLIPLFSGQIEKCLAQHFCNFHHGSLTVQHGVTETWRETFLRSVSVCLSVHPLAPPTGVQGTLGRADSANLLSNGCRRRETRGRGGKHPARLLKERQTWDSHTAEVITKHYLQR